MFQAAKAACGGERVKYFYIFCTYVFKVFVKCANKKMASSEYDLKENKQKELMSSYVV